VNAQVIVETERLRLRSMAESDLDAIARINSDPAVMRFLGNGNPINRADSWRQIAVALGHQVIRGYSMWAIEDRATGAFLGRSGPWFPEGWPMLEVGWLVDPTRQNQGIATEAGRAAVDWCFANLNVDRLRRLIRPDTYASARVASKLGAAIEDRLPDFLGGPTDMWVHRRR